MSPGTQVIVSVPGLYGDATEYHCEVLDTPENRNPVACSCGREGCQSYQTLAFVDKPGILRHVGACRIRPFKGKKK